MRRSSGVRPRARCRRSRRRSGSGRRCRHGQTGEERTVALRKIRGLGRGKRFPGRLIVVEGCDGSGKSTQLHLLRAWLENRGYPVFYTEWNSSAIVNKATRRAKKKNLLTPTTFSLI